MNKIKEFTVDKSAWARGTVLGSKLLTIHGKMCCLGFLGQACGLNAYDMLERNYPQSADKSDLYPELPPTLTWQEIAKINDNSSICDNTREKKLRKLFKEKLNIIVHFKK